MLVTAFVFNFLRCNACTIFRQFLLFSIGVNQWKLNCEADQEDQNKIAIQEWVSTMEGRIRKLGGQGVDRFLSNLFRAFEGMFLGAETPKHSAQKVLNTLQAIREISAVGRQEHTS